MSPDIRQNPSPSLVRPPGIITGLSSGPKMTDAVYLEIRAFIYQLTGIYFQDSKKYLLEGRLGKRLQILGMKDFGEYLQMIRYGTGRQEEMVFNAAFLLSSSAQSHWLAAVEQIAEQIRSKGLALELSGPWPPYHFCPTVEP